MRIKNRVTVGIGIFLLSSSFWSCTQKSYSRSEDVIRQNQKEGENPKPTPSPVVIETPKPTPSPTNTPVSPEATCTETLKEISKEFSIQVIKELEFELGEARLRVTAGETVDIRKTNVGSALFPDSGRPDLSSGGIFKAKNVEVPRGQIRSVGVPELKLVNTLGGVYRGISFDFQKMELRNNEVLNACLMLKANALAAMKCDLFSGKKRCRLVFDGKNPQLNVFDVMTSKVTNGAPEVNISEINISIPPLSKLVIRFSGKNLEWSILKTMIPTNVNPQDVLFVFKDATQISFSKMSLFGNVLAPDAFLKAEGVQWSGMYTGDSLESIGSTFLE